MRAVSVYYPVCLDVCGKRCLVVGGGEVAARKLSALVEAGADVLLVSPDVCDSIVRRKEITVIRRPWEEHDLDGAFLVVVATNDRALNSAVVAVARRKRVLCNVVDDAGSSDFIVPASVRRGALIVSISTSGNLPALARAIREEIERAYGEEYADYLDLIAHMRQDIINSVPDEHVRRELFGRLADRRFIAMLREKGKEATRRELEKLVREAAS